MFAISAISLPFFFYYPYLECHFIPFASDLFHDKFDEKVSEFLHEVGETNLVGVHIINYEQFDVGIQKIMTDYGVLVVYRG